VDRKTLRTPRCTRVSGLLVLFLLVGSAGCASQDGAERAAGTPSANASPSATAEDYARFNAQAVKLPPPPPVVAEPDLRLTGVVSQAEALEAYAAAVAALGALAQTPGLTLPVMHTEEQFAPSLSLMTPVLDDLLRPQISTYLASSHNGGTASGKAQDEALSTLRSLWLIVDPEQSNPSAAPSPSPSGSFSASGTLDPKAGAYAPIEVTKPVLVDAEDERGAAVTVTADFVLALNTVGVDGQESVVRITRRNSDLYLRQVGSKWLLDGWETRSSDSAVVDR